MQNAKSKNLPRARVVWSETFRPTLSYLICPCWLSTTRRCHRNTRGPGAPTQEADHIIVEKRGKRRVWPTRPIRSAEAKTPTSEKRSPQNGDIGGMTEVTPRSYSVQVRTHANTKYAVSLHLTSYVVNLAGAAGEAGQGWAGQRECVLSLPQRGCIKRVHGKKVFDDWQYAGGRSIFFCMLVLRICSYLQHLLAMGAPGRIWAQLGAKRGLDKRRCVHHPRALYELRRTAKYAIRELWMWLCVVPLLWVLLTPRLDVASFVPFSRVSLSSYSACLDALQPSAHLPFRLSAFLPLWPSLLLFCRCLLSTATPALRGLVR